MDTGRMQKRLKEKSQISAKETGLRRSFNEKRSNQAVQDGKIYNERIPTHTDPSLPGLAAARHTRALRSGPFADFGPGTLLCLASDLHSECVWWRKAEDNTRALAESRTRNYPLPYRRSSWKYRQLYLRNHESLKSKRKKHISFLLIRDTILYFIAWV